MAEGIRTKAIEFAHANPITSTRKVSKGQITLIALFVISAATLTLCVGYKTSMATRVLSLMSTSMLGLMLLADTTINCSFYRSPKTTIQKVLQELIGYTTISSKNITAVFPRHLRLQNTLVMALITKNPERRFTACKNASPLEKQRVDDWNKTAELYQANQSTLESVSVDTIARLDDSLIAPGAYMVQLTKMGLHTPKKPSRQMVARVGDRTTTLQRVYLSSRYDQNVLLNRWIKKLNSNPNYVFEGNTYAILARRLNTIAEHLQKRA